MPTELPPIACSLPSGAFHDRVAELAALARTALIGRRREGLTLELRYSAAAADRVRDIVRLEQKCCAFLTFEVTESPSELVVTITAPAHARASLDSVFAPFLGD
jgi:hypothetical protein